MKKKTVSTSISCRLPAVRLFWEDIEAIWEPLTEIAQRTQIETDTHTFDSLADLHSFDEKIIRKLDLTSYSPYVSVRFNTDSVNVYCGDSSSMARGAFEKIRDHLKTKRRPILSVLSDWRFAIGGIVVSFFGMKISSTWTSAFTVMFLLFLCLSFYNATPHFPCNWISLVPKKKHEGFWKRNSDKIWLLVIGAVIGSLVTFVTAMFS